MGRPLTFFYRRKNLSGRVRRQVAEVIGARVNPIGDTLGDICIGVKMTPSLCIRDKRVTGWADYYLDFIDHSTCVRWLARHPEVKVIVCSRSGETYLRERMDNRFIFIPQHHCNVERERRPERPVKVVGYVGLMEAGPPPWYDHVNTAIAQMGLEMRYYTRFDSRQDVVHAYREVDIQFQWCEGMTEWLQHLKNPLRVINGSSYGIPMVSSLNPPYVAECNGYYVGTRTIDEALEAIRALSTDEAFYRRYADPGPVWTEPYHLDHVAAAFRRLADA